MSKTKRDPSENKLGLIKLRVKEELKTRFQMKSIREGGMSKVLLRFIEQYVNGE